MSTEEAAYNVRYYGDNGEMWQRIVRTVTRLPAAVQEFVFERCAFMSVGRAAYGLVMPPNTAAAADYLHWAHDRWIVFLSDDLPEAHAPGIIAHEIAHAYLGHDRTAPGLTAGVEIEAAELAAAWGFDGMATDPEYVTRWGEPGARPGGSQTMTNRPEGL